MEGSAKKRRICGNDGTAGGASSSTHTSTEGQGKNTSSGYDYEVFLSFRGPDTRSAFTDFLYTSLIDAGIRTFKDDEELRVGEEFGPELLQAINQSKISIPIFSKGYASSVWCLKELVQMVECQKTGRQKIMPIFYDVVPLEVRHQTGVYGEALHSHEKKGRYGKEIISQWKAALSAVGEISGWDLHSKTDRREGDFAKTITKEVFRVLKKAYLVVSDCLVNVDNHVDAIMKMIGAQTSETRMIGIHGMGGIGKTTTAKIIYNQLSANFEGCCFLSNIRETSERKGIECLQDQLVSDILKNNQTDIRNIDDGIKIIKDRLSNKRVLLLLDDVYEKNHTDALVGESDWFGRGSKIIITTRNKEVLDVLKVHDCYELTGMDCDQSLLLFSKHAFRRESPLDGYTDQSKRAIGIAGGLPLALEVIGSLLCHTKKEMWDAKLKKLESVPHDKVMSKLKISYDTLDFRQKHIFLDIACLFIGHNKDILVHFWDESDLFPEEAMTVLQNMSLIKINEDNKVWMHDQLRDLGREMVRQESNTKIEKQRRVWDSKEGLDLLRRHKGNEEVEALCLKLDHQRQYRFTYEDFKSLSNLRFLEVDGRVENFRAEERLLWQELPSNVFPTNDNSNFLPQLRWLSWHDIPPTFKITNFSMEDVVFLNLSRSKITDDWKGWSHMKVMKNLKFLDLSSCWNLRRLPDELGGDLANLEYLSLTYCKLLERLPNTIGNLESLIELDISNTRIKELPDSIGKLKNLKVVKMLNLDISKIPNAFWAIEKLEEIKASRIYSAKHFHVNIGNGISKNQFLRILRLMNVDIHALPPRLPESLTNLELSNLYMDTFPDLSNLTNLKELCLRFSTSLDDRKFYGFVEDPIPRWIGNLSKLESLTLHYAFMTIVPADLSLPPQLKSLDLWCLNLRHLPRLPSSLSSLKLGSFMSLCSMEDLSNLKKLSSLHILFAPITEIQGLGCLENLRDLLLLSLNQVEILPNLSNLNKLRSLSVRNCNNLVEIQGELPRFLDRLHIFSCPSLRNLPDLSSFMGKQKVEISFCSKLNVETILEFSQKNPRDLKLVGFSQLHILPDLSNSNELRCLEVSYCHNLVEIQGKLPQSLEELEISSCKSLQKLPHLSSLKGLRRVKINCCGKLNVEAILGFAQKNPLDLQLQILPDLSNSDELRRLRVENYGNLVEIQGELPKSLEKLDISFCESFHKLPDLSSLTGLREICISTCCSLVEIQGELPQSLEKLKISCCESLHKLPELSSLKKLQRVDIEGCTRLKGEAILGSSQRSQANLWENLQYLRICGLGQVEILPDLSNSNKLRHLQVEKCGDLVEIQGELPHSLKELNISSCKSLQKLPDLSSLKGLRRLRIDHCGKLNVEENSWLCSEKLVKFVVEYHESEFNSEYEPEGEDEE